jgi:aldose sugar dehydrogenase
MHPPRAIRHVAAALILAGTATCGPSPPDPPDTGTPGPVETITGRERLGWDQLAGGTTELQTFGFAIYVDGARSTLAAFACDPSPTATGFPCSAPLPPLSPGPHVLELVAVVDAGGTSLESARSAPLRVNVVPAASPAARLSGRTNAAIAAGPAERLTAGDGTPLRLELVISGLDQPTGLAFAGDRLFVAERGGRLLTVDHGGFPLNRAIRLDEVAADDEADLLAMVLHPRFAENGHVYLVFTTAGRVGERSYRMARYRELGAVLGERAILLDAIPAPGRPAAAIGFGADGHLYLALGDDDPRRADDLAHLGGKLLRLNEDGSTPDGNPWRSPVYAAPGGSAAAFDWQPGTRTLWLVRHGAGGAVLGALDRDGRVRESAAPLDGRRGVAAAAFYGSRIIESFYGNLFVASDTGRHIGRVRFDPLDPRRVTAVERLLEGRFGRIRQVAVGPDGALYFATGNATTEAPGIDIVGRIAGDGR